MIKFFKKIRQNLIKENRTSKYLFYAIGEIILVVIGILIALQINNWNINTQNKKQEQQILEQLLVEYTSNLEQINQKIDIRNDMLNSCYSLLRYRTETNNQMVADSIDAHLFRISIRPTFDPELSVTNELINSGKLYLLEDIKLRNKISSYSSSLSELKEEEQIIVNFTENWLIPFLIKNYQIGRMQMIILEDNKLRSKITMGNLGKYNTLKDIVLQSDFKPLLNNPDFEDYLMQLISYTAYTNDQSDGVKLKTESIIDTINLELHEDKND
ncbi:DUF6090 family protein [Bizionia arctica]|uniref:Uncharacterized protein n=1 Tax=Bizionia arctica TaxID=1495645 RepID=A0A917GTR6_9FLAO|nr:DUF6090 family protein [Bizionia arctica]GGG57114.1 hypothetical protein GCM10010976_29940 [Bizionia arctica]